MSYFFPFYCHTRFFITALMATALAYMGVANPIANWSTPYSTGGTIFSSPTIASDGTIYIGSNDNKLHAINSDGSSKWIFTTGDWVDSTPAIGADGTVYFGSWDNQLYAVNPTDGSKLWDFNTSSSIIASPAIGVDGRVYFGSKDEFFYALESNGSLAWETYVGNAITSSAAIGQDGTIYFGDENGTFHALNQDGTTKWTYEVDDVTDTNKSILSSPAIDLSGNLYFGSGNGYCYSIADGVSAASLNWKVGTNDRVDASPVLGQNNEVFFVSRDGYLRSVDTSTGITNWEGFTGDVFYSSPVVDANGRVYVIGYTGFGENHLFAYNNDGSKAWDTNNSSSPLTIGGLVDSSLALDSNGNLFFGCFDQQVYSVNVGSGIADNAWPQFRRDGFRSGAWPSYSISVTMNPAGAGEVNGTGIYNQGATATLNIIPNSNDGYSFGYWNGDQQGSDNPLTIEVNSNINLTANFGLNNYTLSVISTTGGTAIGSGNIQHGTMQTISAAPNYGYSFTGWTGEGVTSPFSYTTTVNMTQARSVTANFSPIQYYVTSTAGIGGSVNEINGSYSYDANISIVATPIYGYTFLNWTQSGNGIANTLLPNTILSVDNNQSVQANFTPINYDLNITSSTGGSVTLSPTGSTQQYNTLVSLVATPENGYYFTGWQGAGINDQNSSSTTITISGDHSIQANFAENTDIKLLLHLKANPDFAAASFNGSGLYDENDSVQISAHPNLGYTFSNWTGGSVIDENSSSTTIVVNQDLNLTAHFNLNQHTLNLSANSGGLVNEVNSSYDYGSIVSLSATPYSGYEFTSWDGNATFENQFSSSTHATITGDSNITALFTKKKYTLVVSVIGNGSTSGAGTYRHGENITLSAQAGQGHTFDKWQGNGITDSDNSSFTIMIFQDLNITATFTESPPQLNETLEVVQFGSSWYSNDWFGYFYQSPSGWCYHFNLGWIYPEIQTDGSMWVWSAQLEWLWMNSTSYATGHAWSAEDNDWVYFDFLPDSGPRVFHFNNESWDTFDKNKIISATENLF
ncbi:PQQ-binding-like beta-propeller repeat protein [Opitutales bacterium]|nr:PQQ-binding-like beta-propeller repeat protein [Opitutales bacterium]